MKQVLAEQFGSEEAFGLYFKLDTGETLSVAEFDAKFVDYDVEDIPGLMSFLSDGGSAVCCTDYAAFIYKALPGRVQIFGFRNEDNPNCQIVKDQLHPQGHDFAMVDDRYLVDPWVRLVRGLSWPVVYDLHDSVDYIAVVHRYGPRTNWKHNTEAERFANKE